MSYRLSGDNDGGIKRVNHFMKIEKLYNLIKQKNFKFTLSDETNSKLKNYKL